MVFETYSRHYILHDISTAAPPVLNPQQLTGNRLLPTYGSSTTRCAEKGLPLTTPGTHCVLPAGDGRMAHFGTNKLDRGDPFPEIELFLTDETRLTIPGQITDSWSVVIIYRGHW